MPVSKKQLSRLIRFSAQLKENRYPNCHSFALDMKKADIVDNQNLACTTKTIHRDITVLKEEFSCPIKFDHARNGYYLTHHGWELQCPQLLDENEMLASVLGARVAENLFPEPLRGAIRNAVDQLLAANNPDFLDSTMVKSLILAPSMQAPITPDIFMTVFNAWQKHEALDIVYKDIEDQSSVRRIEPHVLLFYDGVWYIKGLCLLRQEARVFAIHRIASVIASGKYFEPDDKIINDVIQQQIFEKNNIHNAEILCDGYLRNLLQSKPLHPQQVVMLVGADQYLVKIPAIAEFELINWVIRQCGRATLLKPVNVRKQISAFAEKIAKNHEFISNGHKMSNVIE